VTKHLIYLSVPGLRPQDIIDQSATPTLHAWANAGHVAEFQPSFPCVTSPVQASIWTGVPPDRHGVIANGFYHRDRHAVEFWVARNDVISRRQIWDIIADAPGLTSAVWHAQNIKDAAADFIITPAPIHEPDGSMKLWCYAKPDGLYQQLLDDLGHFPLQHYWGPLANIESSKWILAAAQWLIRRHDPNFHYIYLPHLDYAAQKFGPNSQQATQAVTELDRLLADFQSFVQSQPAGADAVFLVASEYAMTDVSGVVYPNRLLRDQGLLQTVHHDDGERIDFPATKAFAMVDHQCAHIYTKDRYIDAVVELFTGIGGIQCVSARGVRSSLAINHPNSGDVVLAAEPDHWFAYYWWRDDANAPSFAHTVDIHQKPGYDPVELFFDPATRSIPLDASLVKGSHGAPATTASQLGAIICSQPTPHITPHQRIRDVDVKPLVLQLLGLNES